MDKERKIEIEQPASGAFKQSPVCSFNEWDPLEEVIVGIVDGASFPPWHKALPPVLPSDQHETFRRHAGQPFPADRIEAAKAELEELVHILEGEGVAVRRPEPIRSGRPTARLSGQARACTPRCRATSSSWSARSSSNARWRGGLATSRRTPTGPCSRNTSGLGRDGLRHPSQSSATPNTTRNGQRPMIRRRRASWSPSSSRHSTPRISFAVDGTLSASSATSQTHSELNGSARIWRADYRVHVLEFRDAHPMHIDATILPLAPGKLLINPERVDRVPDLFKGWDVLPAPQPVIPDSHTLYMTSKWINMNILMLDEQRVVVERQDEPMISAVKKMGLTPIPCNFRNFNSFGGSFHCATLDVRRRGDLRSYF